MDRLEEAGYVSRERDPADRRRVVIRLVTERAISDIATVFQPMVAAWQQMAERYTDDELRLIVQFYGQMAEVIRQHITVLRAAGGATAGTTGSGTTGSGTTGAGTTGAG
ncbi:MAG TPA: hypothetical protein VN840_07560 [Streptosporangiaceae bacterium]|nr:hypothetical protein [Streptosporangiaceae bacterium]